MAAYIFLNCVGVLDAEDSFTHQNSLLLIAESLQVNIEKSFRAEKLITLLKQSLSFRILSYLRVVSHDVIKACQQTQAGTDLYVHGSVYIVEEVKSLIDQLTALLQKTYT